MDPSYWVADPNGGNGPPLGRSSTSPEFISVAREVVIVKGSGGADADDAAGPGLPRCLFTGTDEETTRAASVSSSPAPSYIDVTPTESLARKVRQTQAAAARIKPVLSGRTGHAGAPLPATAPLGFGSSAGAPPPSTVERRTTAPESREGRGSGGPSLLPSPRPPSSPGVSRRISAPDMQKSRSSSAVARPPMTSGAESGPGRPPTEAMKGDVSVCVRLRPGNPSEACVTNDGDSRVRLYQPPSGLSDAKETLYMADCIFGPDAAQEDVYERAIEPIVESVMRGYNGAVIAYGQTGSGKTHTIVGTSRAKGVAQRAVGAIFARLSTRPSWSVNVSVLEIYNERVRDLLAPGSGVTHVDIHEASVDFGVSFRCPDATRWRAKCPEDALAALTEGMRRRETARTDMNHTSSRSHLIFTLDTSQTDKEMDATLRGRLHLVDLAGSERLKRSMSTSQSSDGLGGARSPRDANYRVPHNSPRSGQSTQRTPRDQRREAGEINKSLSQLALVIQRLTGPAASTLSYVPYRDSMLTRLLAESFGGSSKTCLIITCSSNNADREETRGSLEFGKRAKLVKNKAEINIEVTTEPSAVMQALVAKELLQLQRERDEVQAERDRFFEERTVLRVRLTKVEDKLREASADALTQHEQRSAEVLQLEEEKGALQGCWIEAAQAAADAQQESIDQLARIQKDRMDLHGKLRQALGRSRELEGHREREASLHEEEREEMRGELDDRGRRLEDRDAQIAEIRSEFQRLSSEKSASLARLEQENAALRGRWLEEVSRLEQEKAELAARLYEERASRQQLAREASTGPASRCLAQAGGTGTTVKPLEDGQDSERCAAEEGVALAIALTTRGAALQHSLAAATSDAVRLEQLRRSRIADLKVEAADLRGRWREELPIAAAKDSAPTESVEEAESCPLQSDADGSSENEGAATPANLEPAEPCTR